MSKESVQLTKASVEFLHSVLNSELATDVKKMRKINQVFRCLQGPYDAFHAEGKAIRDKYLEETEVRDQHNNVTKKLVIPAVKNEKYTDEMEKLSQEKTDIAFDRESLVVCKTTMENVFLRPQVKDGLSGQKQLAMFEEILEAVCKALGIDIDTIETPKRAATASADGGEDTEEA